MDDIAKALGISKKTLYQSYSDKDLLIQETVEMTISNHYSGIQCCKGVAAENAIHEQFAINELLGKMMVLAPKIALQAGARSGKAGGFKVLINNGADGGQEVYHMHMHVLAGPRPWKSVVPAPG